MKLDSYFVEMVHDPEPWVRTELISFTQEQLCAPDTYSALKQGSETKAAPVSFISSVDSTSVLTWQQK